MTYISKCDLVVYDLHSGNPEDVQLALDAMMKPRPDDDSTQEKILILISSLLAWDNTPKNLEVIRSPEDIEEEEKAAQEAEAKAAAEAEAARKAELGDEAKGEGDEQPSEVAASDVMSGKGDEAGVKSQNEGEGADGEEGAEEEVKEEEEEVVEEEAKPVKRPRYLHHPFTEADYTKRRASSEYAKIKEVEDRVLNFKKEGVKTYVISAGVLYGLGESIFNHHFRASLPP